MKYFTSFAFAFATLAFCIPDTSFAATPNNPQLLPTASDLSAELSQLNAELSSPTPGSVSIMLSPGQSTIQASTTASGGLLKLTLPTFEHTNPIASGPLEQPVVYLAKITLQYLPCEAAVPTVCVAIASTSYPVMTSDLSQGQTTGYLHYLVTLTNLSSTTAMLQVTDSSIFATLQNKINAIGAQVQALLGT